MTITYRDQLSRDLTPAEVDANFRHVLDSANQSFTQSGTGARSITAQEKLRQIVCAEDYENTDGTQVSGDGAQVDTTGINRAITAVGAGGAVLLRSGRTYIAAITVSEDGVSLIGQGNAAGVDEGTVLKAPADSSTIVTVTGNQFSARNILAMGLSDITERGEDVTNIGWLLDPSADANIDAVFENCGAIYCQDAWKLDGRNVRWNNCLFSASKRGVYVPSGVPADSRGIEIYASRFHSMGKDGASNAACVYVDPAAQWQEVTISAFEADDCLRLFYGFASATTISAGTSNRARGQLATFDATGHTVGGDRRAVTISGVSHWQSNAATVASSGVEALSASMTVNLNGVTIMGCGGYGVDMVANITAANLNGVIVHNAGQATTNTYDCFRLGGLKVNLNGCSAYQDQVATATNKARYGFNTSVTGNATPGSGLVAVGPFATAQFNGNVVQPVKILSKITTGVGNVGTGEDNLQSYSAPASTLGSTGNGLKVVQHGTFANNADAKTLKSYVGATAIVTKSLGTSFAGTWRLEYEVTKTGTDTQDYTGKIIYESADGVWTTELLNGTLTEDDGAAIVIKCTGEATSNSDIVQEYQRVEFLP